MISGIQNSKTKIKLFPLMQALVTRNFKKVIISTLVLISFSCEKNEEHHLVLSKTKTNIQENSLVSYDYHSYWNNKFNNSEFRDSNHISIENVSDNIHKMKFHIYDSNYIDFYNGVIQKEVEHEKGRIINHDKEEIASDSSYFLYRMNLMARPSHFLDIDSSFTSKDSIINGRKVVLFTEFDELEEEDKNIKLYKTYIIDKRKYEPWIIKTTAITNNDTTQIISHNFQNLSFSKQSIDFNKIQNSILELGYAEIEASDLIMEMDEKQIQIGSQLSRSVFQNINGEGTRIFGNSNKRTVLMFSFIGCGGCEYAMKEMKKRDFKFKEDIDFYYSSPIDKSIALKTYFSKKDFPSMGFGQESEMNEDFNAYRFPTFFIIDSSGTVSDIYHGYRNGFEEEIF